MPRNHWERSTLKHVLNNFSNLPKMSNNSSTLSKSPYTAAGFEFTNPPQLKQPNVHLLRISLVLI